MLFNGYQTALNLPAYGLPSGGDFDHSGQVEQAELDLVLLNWGHLGSPNFAGDNVPEPASASSLLLVSFAGVGKLRQMRR